MADTDRTFNHELRDHVTRVGFNLALTRTQIAMLIAFDLGNHGLIHMGNWIPTVNCLRRKGLVRHGSSDYPGATVGGFLTGKDGLPTAFGALTAAGEHVVGLLKESGIYDDYMYFIRGALVADEAEASRG